MDKKNIEELELLKASIGSKATLYDENDQPQEFLILLELKFNNQHYAYFQSLEDEESDIDVFKVVMEDGEYDLQYIEDDQEFESAVEAFDYWTFDKE